MTGRGGGGDHAQEQGQGTFPGPAGDGGSQQSSGDAAHAGGHPDVPTGAAGLAPLPAASRVL
ncbi:hypothetical protein [Acrocarpospora phusangensis]|uniref:hypothetical protein n=1 Tax=Acrocarpospora phusangensis TaxID=1070424 RepID=UPI001951D50F|nr:hypothetical protein [Acrocarpospora phusangensis]